MRAKLRLRASQLISRARDRDPGAIQNMGIDHGCGYIGVPEQFLHRSNVVTRFKQMSSERVSERVAVHSFADL